MPNTLYRLLVGQRAWIVLFVLVVVALISALVLSHIDITRIFPIHLDFVSQHGS